MLAHPTLDKLNDMGLTGMAKAFNELLKNGESEQLSHAEWLGLLLEREWSSRHDRKLAVNAEVIFLRSAEVKFPNYADVDDAENGPFFGGRPRGLAGGA